jgi:folate-binding protein YgfZ
MPVMTAPSLAQLKSRAVIAVTGEGWRDFLQGLITQNVETLGEGDTAFGALLTPQGRLLYDLFVHARRGGCLIDCAADHREALIARLTMYRLRAKVEIRADDGSVLAAWGGDLGPGAAPDGWAPDPRLAALGWRRIGEPDPAALGEAAYEAHRLALGVPGPQDFGSDKTYPIEADFDLLNGIDFRKGCFVGQETTSRMKRRGQIRSRMVPIVFDGPAPPFGSELLSGTLRAGQTLSSAEGRAIAQLRLDRLDSGALTLPDGRSWRPDWPAWLAPAPAS